MCDMNGGDGEDEIIGKRSGHKGGDNAELCLFFVSFVLSGT